MPTRRHFLQGLGAMGVAALAAPRLAHGALAHGQVGCKAYKVLHIYLHGAVSHRETLWIDEGDPEWAEWRQTFDPADMDPSASGATRTWIGNAPDHAVYLGEGLHPLVAANLLPRMRVVAMSNPAPEVHRIAAGGALAGVEVGRPGFASVAARMLARHQDDDPFASFVVDGLGVPAVARYAIASQGLAVGSEPVLLPVGSSTFLSDLERGDREHVDGLVGLYRSTYDKRLTHPTDGRLRSPAFDIYATSQARLEDWAALRDRLGVVPTFDSGTGGAWGDTVRGIEIATHLLESGARHVTVLGGGANDNHFDTHAVGDPENASMDVHALQHNTYLWHVCQALVAAVCEGRLDLNDTLTVIHSEFGRANRNDGTEHHGKGYAGLLLGGPVQQSGLAGRLDFSSDAEGLAAAGDSFTPTDLVAAMSLAGGVAPFQDGMFHRSQLSGDFASDEQALEHLSHQLLGAVDDDCSVDSIQSPSPSQC